MTDFGTSPLFKLHSFQIKITIYDRTSNTANKHGYNASAPMSLGGGQLVLIVAIGTLIAGGVITLLLGPHILKKQNK